MAAVAVAPRTERNHTADASPTLMPLLFKTLKKKSICYFLNVRETKWKVHSLFMYTVYQMLANNQVLHQAQVV